MDLNHFNLYPVKTAKCRGGISCFDRCVSEFVRRATEYLEILLASQAKNRQCQVIHSLDTAYIAIWWPYRARGIVLSDKKSF